MLHHTVCSLGNKRNNDGEIMFEDPLCRFVTLIYTGIENVYIISDIEHQTHNLLILLLGHKHIVGFHPKPRMCQF